MHRVRNYVCFLVLILDYSWKYNRCAHTIYTKLVQRDKRIIFVKDKYLLVKTHETGYCHNLSDFSHAIVWLQNWWAFEYFYQYFHHSCDTLLNLSIYKANFNIENACNCLFFTQNILSMINLISFLNENSDLTLNKCYRDPY